MGTATAFLEKLSARIDHKRESDLEVARLVGMAIEDVTAVDPEVCPDCSDYGRIASHQGRIMYCQCRAGIDALLTDLSKQMQPISAELAATPEDERDTPRYKRLEAHFQLLQAEYDSVERTRWEPQYGRTE